MNTMKLEQVQRWLLKSPTKQGRSCPFLGCTMGGYASCREVFPELIDNYDKGFCAKEKCPCIVLGWEFTVARATQYIRGEL